MERGRDSARRTIDGKERQYWRGLDTGGSTITGAVYQPRHAAYDLKKLRAKGLIGKVGSSRRYQAPPDGLRTIAALVVLRDKVIKHFLAGTAKPKMGRKPKTWSAIDAHYETVRKDMQTLFEDVGLVA